MLSDVDQEVESVPKPVKERYITRQYLESLMQNWGAYVTQGGPTGPQLPTRCGSAESRYADDSSRYVWEGRAYVSRETNINDRLGLLVERAVVVLPEGQRRLLLMRYGWGHSLFLIAQETRQSVEMVEASLVEAVVQVWEILEESHA